MLTEEKRENNYRSCHFERVIWSNKVIYRSSDRISKTVKFYVLLTVHLGIIFVNNQIDAKLFFMYFFYSLHVSGSHVPIIRRFHNTTSGICHSVQITVRYAGFDETAVSSKPAHQTVIYK